MIAERAVQLSGSRVPAYLDTLAAAYAEAESFPEATSTARKALELAREEDEGQLAEGVTARINLYELRKPYHDVREDAQ